MSNVAELNRGTDLDVTFPVLQSDGSPWPIADGWVLSVFEPDAAIANSVTVDLVDAPTATYRLRMEWDSAFRTGRLYRFSLKMTNGAADVGLGQMAVKYDDN